jgi:Raf kinase inhibitor-like YbhB/YbcL family protein
MPFTPSSAAPSRHSDAVLRWGRAVVRRTAAPSAVLAAALLLLPACAGNVQASQMSKTAAEIIGPTPGGLALHSPAFKPGGTIPLAFSAYGRNLSPALAWRAGPAATKSYAVVVEDTDAPVPEPFVHWIIFNLPGSTTSLPQGMPPGAALSAPVHASQGVNSPGSDGYFGPHPPQGPAHHYHFQIFALDETLALPPGADRDALVAAMKGHVLAEDDLVGLFKAP